MNFIVIRAKSILMWLSIIIVIPLVIAFVSKSTPVYNVNGREIPIYSVERDDEKIAITFDCAWNDDDIDVILDILDRYNCKATFFVVGDWVEKYGESLAKIHDRGHEIGNHSYNHKDYTTLSGEQIAHDLEVCDNVIESVIGKRPTLVRAPSGAYNDNVIKTCEQMGKTYIQWSVDSIDYKANSISDIVERATKNVEAGDILLLHNGTQFTAQALPLVLEKLCAQFDFVTVSDLIYKDNYIIDHTGKQKSIKGM